MCSRVVTVQWRTLFAGSEDGGADPSAADMVCEGVAAAAAGFDHGLVLKQDGSLLMFGPGGQAPPGTAPGLHLVQVAFSLPVRAVAAGTVGGGRPCT